MKFRLSTLTLVVALVAVATGWLFERRTYTRKLDQGIARQREEFERRLLDETEREGAVSSTLSAALFTNLIYSQLDELSESEFARKRELMLIGHVFYLSFHQDNAVVRTIVEEENYTEIKDQKSLLLRHGAESLRLLQVNSVAEFISRLQKSDFAAGELLDNDGTLDANSSEFVEMCLVYGRYRKVRFEVNRSPEQSVELAECVAGLVDAEYLEFTELIKVEAEVLGLASDPDGRKAKVLKRISEMKHEYRTSPKH